MVKLQMKYKDIEIVIGFFFILKNQENYIL